MSYTNNKELVLKTMEGIQIGDISRRKRNIEKSLTEEVTLKEWQSYLPNYNINDELPWSKIDIGIKSNFLKTENRRLKTKKQTPWCGDSPCYNCGPCN